MADKKKDLLEFVVEDFQSSMNGRVEKEAEWLDFWKIYLTQNRRPVRKHQSNAISPHGAMTIRQLVPLIKRQILSTRPFIRAIPRKPGLDEQAELIDALLDWWIDVADVRHQFLTLALKEALIFGNGWVKIFHDADVRVLERETIDPATGELVRQPEIETDFGGPRVLYVPCHEVFPDMLATSLEEARFVAHRFFRKKSELLDDPIYDRDAVNSIETEPSFSSSRTTIPLQQIFEEQRRRALKIPIGQIEKTNRLLAEQGDGLVELIEYVSDGKVVTVANRSVVIREADLDHRLPWVTIVPDPIPGELYGKSVLSDAKPSIDQRDFVIRAIFDNLGRVIYKRYIGIAGMFDKRTLHGPPGSAILVKMPDAIRELPQSDVASSAFAVLTHLERDIERGTGLAEPLSAVGPSGPVYNETATTTMAKQEMGLLFVGEMVANVERSLKRMASILFDIESEYMTPGQWIRLAGEKGIEWRQVEVDTIASDWDFRVVGAEYVAGQQARVQAIATAMPWLLQIHQLNPGAVDLVELAKAAVKALQIDQLGTIVPGIPKDKGPEAEHEVMRTGQWVVPEEDEDIQAHLEAHVAEYQRAISENDDPVYVERLADHIEKTMRLFRYLQQKASLMADMATQGQEEPGVAPAEGGGE